MQSNLEELPDLVKLAAEIGIEEVKVVYLTVFDESLMHETLWGSEDKVKEIFAKADSLGEELGIVLKLPHLVGEDVAGNNNHKDCFVAWRDFFLGSDGYVRPCMSTPTKFFKYDMTKPFMDIWNAPEYQTYRANVNTSNMDSPCTRCYQSSHCNWNKKSSFIQMGEEFAPKWEK